MGFTGGFQRYLQDPSTRLARLLESSLTGDFFLKDVLALMPSIRTTLRLHCAKIRPQHPGGFGHSDPRFLSPQDRAQHATAGGLPAFTVSEDL